MEKYIFLEDVALADIAFEAYGKNWDEVFENCALAIFELTANIKTIKPKEKIEVKLENKKIDLLLYDFLSEILFLKDSKYVVFKEVKVAIKETDKFYLSSTLVGDSIDAEKQELENDIKAITMHMFEVVKEGKIYRARVVVDI